jgi:protein SCO1/2
MLLMASTVIVGAPVEAQVVADVPPALEDVGVDEHFDAQVSLDLEFKDEQGRTVRLGDYFKPGRPVILTLNYYRCPMLCGLQLNGFLQGLKELDWMPSDEFDIVTISIDPLETPELAAEKKQNYMAQLGREGAGAGWHFLTGGEPNIHAVAEAVGFRYTYDEETAQYAHAAALMVLTPEGRVARYLYGIEYPASTLKLALLEAGEGEIGSPLDQLLLYCFHYDSTNRQYTPVAMNIMRLGGGLTVSVLAFAIGLMWIREVRLRKKSMKRMSDT